MGKKLTEKQIQDAIEKYSLQGFDTCCKCGGVELHGSMHNFDDNSMSLICDECKDSIPKFDDFKFTDEMYVLLSEGKPVEDLTIVYHYTTVIETINNGVKLSLTEEFIKINSLTSLQLHLDYRKAKYEELYGITESLRVVLNNEKKDEVEKLLINELSKLGMNTPSNLEDIVQYCFEHIDDTADKENWGDTDVVIAFRSWIEEQ